MASKNRETTRTRDRLRFLGPGLLLFLFVACADTVFRSVPELDELASVTASVASHEIDETTLEFRLEGVDHEFKVPADDTEHWYSIVEAAEKKQPLTVTTWPAVLDGKGWPSVSYHSAVPWQIEKDGNILFAYEDRVDEVTSSRRVAWCILLVSGALLFRWVRRFRRSFDLADFMSRRENLDEPEDPDESEDRGQPESSGMPRAARWFWDIFGTIVLGFVVVWIVVATSGRERPIPTAGDLIEKTGVVTDVEIKTRRKSSDSSNRRREIAGFSFALEGQEERWEVPKTHWNHDVLARRIVPDSSVRLLVENDRWVLRHGRSSGVEQLWSVQVDDEAIVSLSQQTWVARKRRERPVPWLFIMFIALVGAACFAHGRLWGGRRA